MRAEKGSTPPPQFRDSHENLDGLPPSPHCFTLCPWNSPYLRSPKNLSSSGPVAFTRSAPVRHSTVPLSQNGRPVATAAVRAQEKPKRPEREKMSCFCRLGMTESDGGWVRLTGAEEGGPEDDTPLPSLPPPGPPPAAGHEELTGKPCRATYTLVHQVV